MTTIQKRINKNILFEAIKIYIKQTNNWDKYTLFLKKLFLLKRIGNESKYGKIFQGYFNYFKNTDNELLSIKIIPINPIDLEIMLNEDNINHKYIFDNKSIWKEIYILRLCFKLLKLKKSIHLPIHYFCLYSNNHDFLKNYTHENPHLFVFNELANDDLKNWAKQERSIHEWISCFLQIFFGLYTLQYYCGIIHNDLHWANILVFNVEKGGCWVYEINEKKYYIENLGYLFVLWDFGMSSFDSDLIKCGDNSMACQDFLKILNTPKWIQKYYNNIKIPPDIISMCLNIRSKSYKNMNELLDSIIYQLSYNQKDNEIIEEYIIN
jgi:hypothetical protein